MFIAYIFKTIGGWLLLFFDNELTTFIFQNEGKNEIYPVVYSRFKTFGFLLKQMILNI